MTLRTSYLAVSLLLCAISAFSQVPYRLEMRNKVQESTRGAMKLLRQNENGTPSVLIGQPNDNAELIAPGSRNSVRDVSLASRIWLASISQSVLGLSENALLQETQIRRTGDVWLSVYSLSYDGVPVRDREVLLNIGAKNGRVIMLRNDLPTVPPLTTTPAISKDVIMSIADAIVGSHAIVEEDAHVVYVHYSYPERLVLCYETTIRTARGDELFRLTFDASTGELLEKKDLIIRDCFRSNPLTSSDLLTTHVSTRKISPQGKTSAATGKITALVHAATPKDAETIVNLSNLEVSVNGNKFYSDVAGNITATNIIYPLVFTSSNLKGRYLTVNRFDAEASTITDTSLTGQIDLHFDNSNSHASERDVYHSIERIRTHVRSLDTGLTRLDQTMTANVNYASDCNAFYDGAQRTFTFFAESGVCNNTAQIADVVYHEFGHRVNHARYSQAVGMSKNMTDGNLNEGFADVISAFMRDDPRIGVDFYVTNPTRTLRNIDNSNKWPKNINSDPHYNGLIVAGAFWDLRKTMGLAETEKLFHMMAYQLPDGNGGFMAADLEIAFTNTLLATLITDDDDNNLTNGSPNMQKILAAFEKHGITLSGLIHIETEQIHDQSESVTEYPVTVRASFESTIGELDTTNIMLHYKHIDSVYFNQVMLHSAGNGTYTGAIPKIPAGSIVEYYASAATTLSPTARKESPSSTTPLRFLVGYQRKIYDDCENIGNWKTPVATDDAAKGLWTHGKPVGTYYQGASAIYVQQDTDHTPTGVHCFVTGNQETTTPTVDDVDDGTTTLLSPTFDLSGMNNPVIRWRYYYSNNTGLNPGATKWLVKITGNGGIDYYTVHNTNLTTNGWIQYQVRVSDYVPLTDDVHVAFIASDNVGCLVEAGVDDVEILDVPTQESVSDIVESQDVIRIFPNPVTGSSLSLNIKDGSDIFSVCLRDVVGKVVHTFNEVMYDGRELHLPEWLSNGTYLLEYTHGGATHHEKIILSR